jgi:plasmid maintenance system antidote protein VapI
MSVDREIDMGTEQQDEFSPVAPGEILAEEFLAGFALTQAQLVRAWDLVFFFGTLAEFWMNLQAHYDLKLARRALGPETAERIAAQRVAWRVECTQCAWPGAAHHSVEECARSNP